MRERRGQVGHETDNPYYEGRKYPEPTVCEECGLLYRDGHWQHPRNAFRPMSTGPYAPPVAGRRIATPEGSSTSGAPT